MCKNKWENGFLWANENLDIPDIRKNAYNRFILLEKPYSFDLGFVVKANDGIKGKRLWYLFHFGVRNLNKPGKLRFVFDCAAKSFNVSFNDLLLTGPDLLRILIGILMRFRQFLIAFKADLRDMLLEIGVREEDQDAQRFLWRGRDRSSLIARSVK